jgi:uncharacterized protein (DUF1501 family)
MSWMRRRDLLQASLAATALSGTFGSILPKLALAEDGTRLLRGSASGDYRALVCVYLYGGYDCFSAVVPIDGPTRTQYEDSRRGTGTGPGGGQQNPSDLRIASADLVPLFQDGTTTPISQGGSRYGLHPRMAPLAQLFNQRRAAIVANVGPLVRPLNLADYNAGTVPVPAQLYSHSDQTVLWQTPRADTSARTGWGGRLADVFFASNPNPRLSMNVSLDGENVFQAGQSVLPYFVGDSGVEAIRTVGPESWRDHRRNTFNAMLARAHGHPFERAMAQRVRTAEDVARELEVVLRSDRNPANNGYLDDTYQPFWTAYGLPWQRLDQGRAGLPRLGRQLLMIARVMRQRLPLQMTRQLFFAGVGGFDTHDNQNADLPNLLGDVASGIRGFYDVLAAAGIADKVTTFTASEFGRTLSNNGDGTDHGWGGHQFVIGDGVIGGRVYGQFPHLGLTGNPQNAGWGQLIPTLAADQYAATMATWYGLPDAERNLIFPNVQHMVGTKVSIQGPNLGFMQPFA